MSDRRKDNHYDELYDEKYEDLSLEEFQEALEEEEPFPKRVKRKKKKRWGVRVVAVLLSAMLIFQVSAVLFDTFRLDAIEFLKTSYRLSQSETIQDWKESVVVIQGEGRFGRSKGTGFFIDESGLLLTNHHVIEDQDSIGVSTEDGEVYEGRLIASDPEQDLALVDIDGEEFRPLRLQEERSEEGDHIFVIGNPLSFTKIANEGTVLNETTTGRESSLGISAPIYRGNSGSPVITEDGKVTGVVYAKTTVTHSGQESIGLAVPIDDVHRFLDESQD